MSIAEHLIRTTSRMVNHKTNKQSLNVMIKQSLWEEYQRIYMQSEYMLRPLELLAVILRAEVRKKGRKGSKMAAARVAPNFFWWRITKEALENKRESDCFEDPRRELTNDFGVMRNEIHTHFQNFLLFSQTHSLSIQQIF